MSKENMIKHAREKNLVRFQRAFKEAIAERLPEVLNRERARIADIMFHPNKR